MSTRPCGRDWPRLWGRIILKRPDDDSTAFTLKGIAGRIECPCLIVHGECDQIIPVSEARRLYEALNCPKELKIWEGANHNCDNFDIESKAFMFDWLKGEVGLMF